MNKDVALSSQKEDAFAKGRPAKVPIFVKHISYAKCLRMCFILCFIPLEEGKLNEESQKQKALKAQPEIFERPANQNAGSLVPF